MRNDRPIDNPNLRAALREIQKIVDRRGLACAVMLVAPQESAFSYKMDAPWSAIMTDPTTDSGFRMRADTAELGAQQAHKKIEGAAHTICSMLDFGSQTEMWMEDLLGLLQSAGVEVHHTPFGGEPLARLTVKPRSD
jgi:hypothetical protein